MSGMSREAIQMGRPSKMMIDMNRNNSVKRHSASSDKMSTEQSPDVPQYDTNLSYNFTNQENCHANVPSSVKSMADHDAAMESRKRSSECDESKHDVFTENVQQQPAKIFRVVMPEAAVQQNVTPLDVGYQHDVSESVRLLTQRFASNRSTVAAHSDNKILEKICSDLKASLQSNSRPDLMTGRLARRSSDCVVDMEGMLSSDHVQRSDNVYVVRPRLSADSQETSQPLTTPFRKRWKCIERTQSEGDANNELLSYMEENHCLSTGLQSTVLTNDIQFTSCASTVVDNLICASTMLRGGDSYSSPDSQLERLADIEQMLVESIKVQNDVTLVGDDMGETMREGGEGPLGGGLGSLDWAGPVGLAHIQLKLCGLFIC